MLKIITFILAALLTMPSASVAQQGAQLGKNGRQIPFAQDNEYLETLLELRLQIDLLTSLGNRQQRINEMAESYASLSIPFIPPAPKRNICQKIPANLLCSEHYPNLYPDFMDKLEPESAPQLDLLPTTKNIEDVEEEEKETLKRIQFAWTDISCLAGECQAVIAPQQEGSTARYTIKQGSVLPSGAEIVRISANGVDIIENGEEKTIEPAPSAVN